MRKTALPLSHLRVVNTHDPLEAFAFGKSAGQNIEQIRVPEKADGPWRCEISALKLSSSYLTATSSSGYEVEGATLGNTVVVLPLSSFAEVRAANSSRLVEHGSPFVLPSCSSWFRRKNGFSGLSYILRREDVVKAIQLLELNPNEADLKQGSFRAGGADLSAFGRALTQVAALHEVQRKLILDQTAFAERSHDFLVQTLALDLVREGSLPQLQDADIALFRRARDYIEARFDHPVKVTEIAELCSCGVRRLLHVFRKFAGTTVIAYLNERRLERARMLLTYATPDETVTSIALRSGFIHLGEFSLRYRAKYGETPSATLRRSPF